MSDRIWIVAANSAGAVIWQAEGSHGPLRQQQVLVHPEARQHNEDLVTDQPGRVFDSAGQGRHATDYGTSPKDHEAEVFARELIAALTQAHAQDRFDRLYVIAAPAFLGRLREQYSEPLRQLLAGEIDKNVVHDDADAVRAQLPERL